MHLPLYSNLNGSLEFNGQLRPTPKFFQEMLSTIGTLHRILFSFVNSTKILSIEWHKVEWKLGENYICWNSMILVTLLVVRTGASFIFHGGSGIEVLAWKKKLKKRVKLFEHSSSIFWRKGLMLQKSALVPKLSKRIGFVWKIQTIISIRLKLHNPLLAWNHV